MSPLVKGGTPGGSFSGVYDRPLASTLPRMAGNIGWGDDCWDRLLSCPSHLPFPWILQENPCYKRSALGSFPPVIGQTPSAQIFAIDDALDVFFKADRCPTRVYFCKPIPGEVPEWPNGAAC